MIQRFSNIRVSVEFFVDTLFNFLDHSQEIWPAVQLHDSVHIYKCHAKHMLKLGGNIWPPTAKVIVANAIKSSLFY